MAGASAGGLVQVSLLFQSELGGQATRSKQPVLFHAGATVSDVLRQSAGIGGARYPLWPVGFGDLAISTGAQFLALCRNPRASEGVMAGPNNASLLSAFFSDFISVANTWRPVAHDVVLADLVHSPSGTASNHVEICVTLHFPSKTVGAPCVLPMAAPVTQSQCHVASGSKLGNLAAKSAKSDSLQAVYTAETCATLEQVPALSRQSSCSSLSSHSSVASLPSIASASSPRGGDGDESETGCATRKLPSSFTFRAPPGLDPPEKFDWVCCSEIITL